MLLCLVAQRKEMIIMMGNPLKWFRAKFHGDLYAHFNDTHARLDDADVSRSNIQATLKNVLAHLDSADMSRSNIQATLKNVLAHLDSADMSRNNMQATLKDVLVRLDNASTSQSDIQAALKDVLTQLDSAKATRSDMQAMLKDMLVRHDRADACQIDMQETLKSVLTRLDSADASRSAMQEVLWGMERCITPTLGVQRCIYPVEIDGERYMFYDGVLSYSAVAIARELNKNCYKLDSIAFEPGDVVIDIGANTGMFSISLARKYPFLQIISVEPVVSNFQNFVDNIKLNNIPDGIITPVNAAMTADGRWIDIFYTAVNSGGSNMFGRTENSPQVCSGGGGKSVTLLEICQEYALDKIRIIKMDCEGAEFEILRNCPVDILRSVDHFRGEFHNISEVNDDGDSLLEYIKQYIKDVNVEIHRGMPKN